MLETIFSWNTLYWLLIAIYIPSCIGLIIIVLLQKGKNMGFAGAFGVNPGGDTVLGPRGARSLPVRMTYFMAAAYMIICILFALIEGRRQEGIAPEKVDPAAAAQLDQFNEELDALGVGKADTEEQPASGAMEGDVAEEPAVDEAAPAEAAAVDEAAPAEPEAAAGDETKAATEGDTQAEIESMPKEDTP